MLTLEQRTILSEGMAEMLDSSGGNQIVDGLAHTQLVNEALQSIKTGNLESARKAADSGIKDLHKRYGAYTSWSTTTRSQAGFLLAFYYVLQALIDQLAGRSCEARDATKQALAIRECTGKLQQMAQTVAEDASVHREQLTQYVYETNACYESGDYWQAITSADMGITLIELEQAETPDWAGNDLARLYAVRGQSQGMLGLQNNNKSLIHKGVVDLDKALSFPAAYYINPQFRDDVKQRRDVLKEHDSKCFIATAAYGTPLAPEIDYLRRFRDQQLLPHPVGKVLVLVYEHLSPPFAAAISTRPHLQQVVRRWLIEPAVSWIRRQQ